MTRKQTAAAARPPKKSASSLDVVAFRLQLATWYRNNARRLPWRGVEDPYAIWISEVMLQQTRVATVIERYTEFLTRFPTIDSLAKAAESEVLALWSGLGYYRRARMLHAGAQYVLRELGGTMPNTRDALLALPGIGPYTAAAIASIAFGEPVAVLDGNVERVLLRILGLPEDKTSATKSLLTATAQSLIPPKPGRQASDHNQAMMELGATVCLPRNPLCLHCPVVALCRTRGEHPTATRASMQRKRTAHLLLTRKRGATTEVLLERRSSTASLMASMLELPPLPLEPTQSLTPLFELKHAITNTNYSVGIFAASTLKQHLTAASSSLLWIPTSDLSQYPLTGLARKALKKAGLLILSR